MTQPTFPSEALDSVLRCAVSSWAFRAPDRAAAALPRLAGERTGLGGYCPRPHLARGGAWASGSRPLGLCWSRDGRGAAGDITAAFGWRAWGPLPPPASGCSPRHSVSAAKQPAAPALPASWHLSSLHTALTWSGGSFPAGAGGTGGFRAHSPGLGRMG